MRPRSLSAVFVVLTLFALPALAEETGAGPRTLPVREVTVFKDGHAFLLHAGTAPVDERGHVVLDRLPAPVLGTFWPFSAEPTAPLRAVRTGRDRVEVARTALGLVDLLTANVGAQVVVTDVEDHAFHARIRSIPTRSGEEIEATTEPGDQPPLPQRGQIILLQTEDGLKAMPLDRIREVAFREDVEDEIRAEEIRNRMTLELDWTGARKPEAEVGMMYLQKGLRWIPSYQVDLQDDGTARVRLQATLVNDLIDLEDVSVNLVVGVPTFTFEHVTDPIIAQVAARMPRQAYASQYLSNAVMSQMAVGPGGAAPGAPAEDDALQADAAQREDLYVFSLEHVSLRRGERLVLPVAESTAPYEHLYTLELPFSPPPEAWPRIAERVFRNDRELQTARALRRPQVMHEVRLTNRGPHPFTTAPALVLRNGRVLAQGMMTYTSVKGDVDLPVTSAVDLKYELKDRETDRIPDAVRWQGNAYARTEMAGSIRLTSYKDAPVHLRVTRFVLGDLRTATHDGEAEVLNLLEDATWTSWVPVWWRWYDWPYWWYHFNPAGKVTWDLTVDPDETVELGYTWHYYWP